MTSGTPDAAAIQRMVRRHRRSLQACFQRARARTPDLGGKLVLQLTVSTRGTVSASKIVTSQIASPAFARCVRRQVRSWRFPRPAKTSDLEIPFVFRGN